MRNFLVSFIKAYFILIFKAYNPSKYEYEFLFFSFLFVNIISSPKQNFLSFLSPKIKAVSLRQIHFWIDTARTYYLFWPWLQVEKCPLIVVVLYLGIIWNLFRSQVMKLYVMRVKKYQLFRGSHKGYNKIWFWGAEWQGLKNNRIT